MRLVQYTTEKDSDEVAEPVRFMCIAYPRYV